MRCLGPHGSCQTQMMQVLGIDQKEAKQGSALGIDQKEAKQGPAQGSCGHSVKVTVAEPISFPNILEQFLALSY